MKVDESKLKVPEGWSNEPKDLENFTHAFPNYFLPRRKSLDIDELLPVLASKDKFNTKYLLKGMKDRQHGFYMQWNTLSQQEEFYYDCGLEKIFLDLADKKVAKL